jgi:adenosine deaminase
MSWYPRISTDQLSFYRKIPKVDLHRHLEGSLRISTLIEIARQHGMPLPEEDFHSLVQMQQSDPLTFTNFLSKFQTLRQFYRSPEVIERVTYEAIADAAADGVVYLELRFTPAALGRLQGFSLAKVMDWVTRSAEQAGRQYHLHTRLIASVNRNEPVEIAEEVARLAAERLDKGVVALDLAGNEAEFPMLPFAGVFRDARESGLHITVHAGEWGGPENIRQAILYLGAERIGHGVRVVEDPDVLALVRERQVPLEVCVTSNYQSGVVSSLRNHPLPSLIESGLKVTLNTDDPSISNISLSDEYRLVLGDFGLHPQVLKECVLNGARASFLPEAQARVLERNLDHALKSNLRL